MRRMVVALAVLIALLGLYSAEATLQGFVKCKDGYLYDNVTGKAFVPHGIAYQTWNRPLGVWQTKEQIDYDLDEMVKMGANSIRVDFVWQHIEENGDNQWSWDNYDYLVEAAEARDLRIFALIGYQWPPNWFPDNWYTMHPPETDSEGIIHTERWQSDIIAYETAGARAQYYEWINTVCARYKNSKAIAGWIVGNESGYLGLWSGLLDGYDADCEAAFRTWCEAKYTNIASANAVWGTGYAAFSNIVFVEQYRAYGAEGAQWADMVQWREDSIANFTALGAKAAKVADTNHLISYSTVGMQWGEEDWRYHAEDRGKITTACLATNAPIDFFSVNNYPWSILGHESQQGHWGISYTKKVAKVPVLYSETGFTSSETMWPGMDENRQGPLVRNSLWESLEAGAIGTHIFSWMDRPYITVREKGFGILYADRGIKPAFWVSRNAFNLMDEIKIGDLLMGSQDPTPDVAFLWTAANDSQYNRYECEMQQEAGALERLGYEPWFINLEDLGNGAYTNYKAIFLPRNMRVDKVVPGSGGKGVLEFLRTVVIPAGVNVVACGDLPGLQDPNGNAMTNFVDQVKALFGVDASDIGGYEVPQRRNHYVSWYWHPITVTFNDNALGALTNGYSYGPQVWKYSDEVTVDGGTLWASMDSGRNKGYEDSDSTVSGWDGTWGNVYVRSGWGWAYDGDNMVQMWGDSGMWEDFPVVPFGRYTCSTYFRNNSDDPLHDNAYAAIGFEWYGEDGEYLGKTESAHVITNTAGGVSASPNLAVNPGFETNGANWSVTGQLNIEDGFAAYAAESGSYGAWITNNSGEHYIYQQIPTNVWSSSYGGTFVLQVRAKKAGSVPGSIKLELYHPWVICTNIDITSALTTNWQTFSLYYHPTAGPEQYLELRLRNATGGTNYGQVMYDNIFFGLTNVTDLGDTWVRYAVDAQAPSNTFTARKIIRMGYDNLLVNGELSGTGTAPDSWQNWTDSSHDPETAIRLGTSGNAWAFWYDGGIYQDITNGFAAGDSVSFGGWLYMPSGDALRNGTKHGKIEVEFYNGATLLQTNTASPVITSGSTPDIWNPASGSATVPAGTTKIRVLVRCNDGSSGDGRFIADDIYFRDTSRGGGSVYVDNLSQNPAMVVMDHGAAKAALFTYGFGDISPDGDRDGEMDILPWKWRYDIMKALMQDYFGVQPKLTATGTNAFLCLPEYRTCTNGALLLQVKNYMYDTNFANGGSTQLFTISSSMFTGRTIVAYELGKVLEQNCDGTFQVPLAPDGQDMILAYTPGALPQQFVRILDAPSLVHPFGSKCYQVSVAYDCLASSNLLVKAGFQEVGDNGDGVTNEFYAIVTNAASGAGQQLFYIYIPDYNQNDSDYMSTEDGGKYQFVAWLETNGTHLVDAEPIPTQLKWGVRPSTNVPTSITKGQSLSFALKWEDLYETLSWQNTPLTRNSAYPGRVALYRSSKTEAQFPGHWAKANAVCDWLESMGYEPGNALDILFDNVVVSNGLLSDSFTSGSTANWTRVAGCANWTVDKCAADWGSALIYNTYTTFALSNAMRAISFKVTADASKTVDKVYLYLSRTGTSPTYTLGLYSNNASGLPDGTPYSSVNFTVVTSAYHWLAIDLPDYTWTAGQTYHFVLKYASGTVNSTNRAIIEYIGAKTPGRGVLTSTNNGTSWTTTTYEPTFRVLYTDTNSFVQPYVSAAGYGFLGTTNYGQKFTLPYTIAVTNISVRMYRQSTATGSVQMCIRKWSDKSLVVSSVVAKASVPTTNTWVKFNFASPITLTASNMYYFELKNLSPTGLYYACRGNTLSRYGGFSWGGTNDCSLFTTNSGSTWLSYGDYDLGFTLGTTLGDGNSLRAWRIGNDDNILVAGGNWTNYTVSADIKYKKQDNYFSDAEIYFRYQNRSNFYKVGIRNFYGAWRLKYTVRVNNEVQQAGWLHYFAKTNRPVENTWYNLKIDVKGSTNSVYFNNELVGTFYATNFATGKVGLGSKASQLGTWDPQKGYYFIDDDEFSTLGGMLNMDWGYLREFFPTLILPGVYVMNDAEAASLVTFINSGLFNILSTDGGVAMKNEAGSNDLGRVESVFGVSSAYTTASNLSKLVVGSDGHYVTLDYSPGTVLSATGSATAYTVMSDGDNLAVVTNSSVLPALVVNTTGPDPVNVPAKVMTFNFAVDTQGQLTNAMKQIAQRGFEWLRGQALKVTLQLKYRSNTTNSYEDFVVYSTNGWILSGSGETTLTVNIPTNGIMTGDDLYWVAYVYPWDSTDSYTDEAGFYTSMNDGTNVSIAGVGLQILGITDVAYAGRDWDKWLAYNTRTQTLYLTYGIKDKGLIVDDDNFDDGDTNGWSVTSNTNIQWRVTNQVLRATVVGSGGYAYIMRTGWTLNDTNITAEYDTRFMNGAKDGGFVYRGRVLYVSPNRCGWNDNSPSYYSATNLVTGAWHHIVINVRDGDPYPRSDLYVNNEPVFRDEPIESTNWTTNTVGFLSPYSNSSAYVEWDNMRLRDEQYATVWESASGVSYPTNGLPTKTWPSIPDYDAAMWEHAGTLGGATYEWYVYFRGTNISATKDVQVYFAPRLIVEDTNFPTSIRRGTSVSVPIEWEDLGTNLPTMLEVRLEDPYIGTNRGILGSSTFTITNATGSGWYSVAISNSAPSGSNYLWLAYMYPPAATNPMLQRIGLDDTFRFTPEPYGAPVNPEVRVSVYALDDIYTDGGIPSGSDIYTWAGDWSSTSFDSTYTNVSGIPEGSQCFFMKSGSWAGWGVFSTPSTRDMSAYSNGYVKFYLKSTQSLKIQLEGPAGTQAQKTVPTTSNAWKEVTLSMTNFPGLVLTNMYGLFGMVADSATTNYVDNVRWTMSP